MHGAQDDCVALSVQPHHVVRVDVEAVTLIGKSRIAGWRDPYGIGPHVDPRDRQWRR